jgi:hypothetical protein
LAITSEAAGCQNVEDYNFNSDSHENIKSHMIFFLSALFLYGYVPSKIFQDLVPAFPAECEQLLLLYCIAGWWNVVIYHWYICQVTWNTLDKKYFLCYA